MVGQIDLDIQAQSVNISEDGLKLNISWPDNHVSEFDSTWLHKNRLKEKEESLDTNQIVREGVRLWGRKDMQDKIPRFHYEAVLTKDETLYDWLFTLHSVGIAMLFDVPKISDPIPVQAVAKRVGYVKCTHYGYFFDVIAKFDANNVAYTTKALPPHCDLVQTEYYPGAQFLHCLAQIPTKGGSNTFADGFKVARDFKKMEPELFRLLSDRPIPHVDIGVDVFGEYHVKNSRPVFEIDHNGKIIRVTHNNHVRDYHLNNPPEEVCELYKGYNLLGQMMRDPENSIEHKMEAGEMVTFNNSRVFHGRTEFTPTNVGDRHLQGTYLDWDLMYARLRSLGQSLGRPFRE